MRIIIVHMHLRLPAEGGALRSFLIARGLRERGHDIEVITSHPASYYEKLQVEGLKIHRIPVSYRNEHGFLRRIRAFLKFNHKAYRLFTKLQKPDLLYCISTPLTTGLLGRKIKKQTGIPYIFEVGDLWPEAPIQMGVVRSSFLKTRLYELEKSIYQEAERIIALSLDIEKGIRRSCPDGNIFLLPNMADNGFFETNKKADRCDEIMPGFSFLLGYFGAIGKANHLDFLVELARYCREEAPQVGFIVMGEGSEKLRLMRESYDLPNIKFLPLSNRKIVKEVLESMDAVYISYKDVPILETGSPNKYFDALAAGKMVIANFGGWIKNEIENAGCGFSYDPHDPSEFKEKLAPYLTDEGLIDEAGEAAHHLAATFDMEKMLDEFSREISTYSSVKER